MRKMLASANVNEAYDSKGYWVWYTPLLLAGIVIAANFYSFLLFHSLAEFFTVTVAILMCVVAWQTHPFTRNNFLMYLGCGYFWVACLDMMHTLVYKGMEVFPIAVANPSAQLWIGSRYLEALLLVSAPYFLSRDLNRNKAFTGFGVLAITIYTLVMTGYFPDAFIEGQGLTPFKVNSEYVIIAILAAAMAYLYRRRHLIDNRMMRVMIASLAFTMCAELAFTFYISVYGISNQAGHIFKLFSFWLIFVAIIHKTLKEPFSMMAKGASTYDAIPVATVVVDDECVIRQANRSAYALAGVGESSLVGSSVHSMFHPERFVAGLCPVCQHIKSGVPIDMAEYELPEKARWYDFTLSSIFLEQGVKGMVHVVRDITERKAESEKTQKIDIALRRFRGALDSSEDCAFLIDPVEMRFIDFNQTAVEELGYSREELMQMGPADIKPGFEAQDLRAVFDEVVTSSEGRGGLSTNHLRKDGSAFPVEIKLSRQIESDGAVIVVATARDITDRKRAEYELDLHRHHLEEMVEARTRELAIARDEALTATKVKSMFLANMSHELRTPLNSIIGFSGILKAGMAGEINDEQSKQLNLVYDSANHLLNLINDILDLSKVEAGQMDVNISRFSVAGLLRDLTQQMGVLARDKKIEFSAEVAHSIEDVELESDREKVFQVLLNLLSNAIKFTSEGYVKVSVATENGQIAFYVEDTGRGIKHSDLGSIFDSFKQVDDSDNRAYPGTGLGLAISQKFVAVLAGTITAQSERGIGSTFCVTLPLKYPHLAQDTSSGVLSLSE